MKQEPGRPAIPQTMQRELWGRAAGRCQFRGCNVLLYKDDLTQQQSNLGVISHIVSYSPKGPRGDIVRSNLLATDINNLMLTCRDHGKLIDDKAHEEEYPEALLLACKSEHENRVRQATEQTDDAQTHVLLLQVPIDGQDVSIHPTAAHRAILPRYPTEEHPLVIDLSGTRLPAEGEAFFTLMAQSITNHLQAILTRRAGAPRIHHISVFALAPIPLLIHTGRCLGDIDSVDLYQRHRDQQDWAWKQDEDADVFYEVITPEPDADNERPIACLFSISGWMSRDRVTMALSREPLIYEIRAREPGRDFLRSRKRLELFAYEVRKLLVVLHDAHERYRPIHVFPALPAPMAIAFGRSIKAFDTPFIIYELTLRSTMLRSSVH